MKQKVLILGTSNGSCDMVRKAKSMGLYTIVTDYLDPKHSMAKLIADEYWMVNLTDLDKLEYKCREEGVIGILAGASDFTVDCAIELSERLSLPFYCTKSAWHYSKDKADFKRMCIECGAPVAKDYFLSENPTIEEMEKIQYPVVVKPVDQAGNKGVSFCCNKEELNQAISRVREVSKNPKMVIEKMLRGREWYGSYVVQSGEVEFLQLDAMYHEEGYPTNCYTLTTTLTAYENQFKKEINPYIEKVLRQIGCTDGFVWVQVMLDEDGHFYVIEMGYRLDGDMMFATTEALHGYDTLKAIVEKCCGLPYSQRVKDIPAHTHTRTQVGCGHMLWTKKSGVVSRIEGLDKLKEKYPAIDIDVRQVVGNEFGQYSSLGTIVYTAKDGERLCEVIKYINDNVHVYDEKGEDVIIPYTDFNFLMNEYKLMIK